MRRLPVLVTAVAAAAYAAAAYLFLLPDIVLPTQLTLADLPGGSCADPSFLAEVRRRGEVLFVPLSQIPLPLQQALLDQEDRRFFVHRGVNWETAIRALGHNLAAGEVRYGASTLTMQLARELFLDKRRRIWRKLRETAYALQLERRLNKGEILELYLNVVDWGSGLRGVGAAACSYYRVPPAQLTNEQASRLVSLLPSPERRGAVLESEMAQTPATDP